MEARFPPGAQGAPAFIVAGLSELVTRLEAAGHRAAEDQSLEGFDRTYVHDPFGNRIELMEPSRAR